MMLNSNNNTGHSQFSRTNATGYPSANNCSVASTSNDAQIDSTTAASSTEGDNKQLFMFLNSIILQYLEILGLEQTYSTFSSECLDEGYPIPPSLSTSMDKWRGPTNTSELRHKDVEQILKYFDEEDATGLIKKWEDVLQKSHPENQVEVFKINVQLRIYVYITLPSRRECSDDERQINIQYLIEDFKSRNHDDVNDPEVLSLYALPFVTNPVHHPVFCKFFTKAWIDNLRKSLKNFCMTLCRRLPDPFDSDIAKLYRLWSNTNNVMHEFNFANLYSRHRSSDTLRLMPSNSLKQCKFPEDSFFKFFFDSVLRLKDENEKLQQHEMEMKATYMQKIQLCDALVSCLKDIYDETEDTKSLAWNRLLEQYSQSSLTDSLSQMSLGTTSGRPSFNETNAISTGTILQQHVENFKSSACHHQDNDQESARIIQSVREGMHNLVNLYNRSGNKATAQPQPHPQQNVQSNPTPRNQCLYEKGQESSRTGATIQSVRDKESIQELHRAGKTCRGAYQRVVPKQIHPSVGRSLMSSRVKTATGESGTGDHPHRDYRVEFVPPPPLNYDDRQITNPSVFSGVKTRTNQILCDLVRESARIDEE